MLGGISIITHSIRRLEKTFTPRVEQEYRAARWRTDLIICLSCVVLLTLINLGKLYSDSTLEAAYIRQHDFTLQILVRVLSFCRIGFTLFSILFGVWLLKMLAKPKPFYQKYDRYVFFWLISLGMITNLTHFTTPRWPTEVAGPMVALILYYLVLPQHNFWLRILPNLFFTVLQLILYAFGKTPASPPIHTNFYFSYILSNMIGIIYSHRLYMNERRNFALHRKKDRMTALLTADKKKLQREKELVARYEAELRRQEVGREKLKALQAQIKPHFLFNSLSTIAFYCRTNATLAYQLVNDLATYLQNTFALQSQVISWDDELKIVRAYLSIEAARMEERLNFSIEETGDLNECRLPPFTVQPLVENAIRHGLSSLPGGGALTIAARAMPDHYYFEVKDNGRGFNPKHQPNTGHRDGNGIGLLNIEERLRGLYGHGLRIDSRPGGGTLVSFSIPKPGNE